MIQQEHLSNLLFITPFSTCVALYCITNQKHDWWSIPFSLPLHIHKINNYFTSAQKQNQSWSHFCINNLSYVYTMMGSRGWGDRSCFSLKCMCEVICCDQGNAALTWPAVSHSWSFTGLPSTATTAAEKNTFKSETTVCVVGFLFT